MGSLFQDKKSIRLFPLPLILHKVLTYKAFYFHFLINYSTFAPLYGGGKTLKDLTAPLFILFFN